MKNFPAHIDATEAQIIDRVISDALAAGCTISVFDGEEWALKLSTDAATIQRETAATDVTTFRLRRDGETVGSVLFIHGNGCDVLSDYSDSATLAAILADASALAETLY